MAFYKFPDIKHSVSRLAEFFDAASKSKDIF